MADTVDVNEVSELRRKLWEVIAQHGGGSLDDGDGLVALKRATGIMAISQLLADYVVLAEAGKPEAMEQAFGFANRVINEWVTVRLDERAIPTEVKVH